MKNKLLLGCLAAFLLLSSCRRKVDGLGIQLSLEKSIFSNGMTVILVEDHTVPVVSYQTWFRVGSVDESPGVTGVSHLFEHLMFKGTEKYGSRQFFQQLEGRGAEVNAFTTRDYTVYYETFVKNLLEKVIDMESDRMANLIINNDILKSEKMVVLEERRLRIESIPEAQMQEALWNLAYRVHPYQWPVIGYPEDILNIEMPQLIDYFKSHYQPANAAVIIVGDFNSDQALTLLKKYYEKIPSQPVLKRTIIVEPEQTEERRLVIRDHVASERFAQAYHVSAADQSDSYALDVLANILFEGSSSRAYRRLVEEKDILEGISGSAYTPTFPGLFIITGTMKAKLPSAQAENALTHLIDEVQNLGVTEEEVRIAVKQLTVQLMDSVRTPYGLGQLIGTVQTIFENPTRFIDDLSKYSDIHAIDIQRVAQKYLNPNNRSVVTLVPRN